MSRSYRKNSIIGNLGRGRRNSEKKDKRVCNKKLRRQSKNILKSCTCEMVCSCIFPNKEDVFDVWVMTKDGKHYFDKIKYPKLLRK